MEKSGFFYRILLPSMAAVVLFLAAIYLFVIPTYRESLLDKKRETIRELTNTSWSILQKLDQSVSDTFPLAMAQLEARLIIGSMRYGEEQKDYFWITDTNPRMVMHPYRPQMNGMLLADYTDQEGKRFFVEIVEIVKETGSGYIDYKWQWKDDSLMVVPKLSFVKLYAPWGWIIGTGIYVEDVKREITAITRQVVWISFVITLVIAAIIAYLARKNYLADRNRQRAQERLQDTMEKYKRLVEASTDGVLMTMDGAIIYANPCLLNLLGFSQLEADENDPEFLNSLNCLLHLRKNIPGDAPSEIVKEHRLRRKNKLTVDVIVSRSEFDMEGKRGFIYTIKDVSRHKDVERELDLNMEKFKTIADSLHMGVFRCTIGRSSRFVELNRRLPQMLGYASEAELRGIAVQELFFDRPEKKEVIRAISEGVFMQERLLRIKKADGSILPALVSLFPVKDVHDKVVYCDGILLDAYEHLSRNSGFSQHPPEQHFSANVLLQPVKDYSTPAPLCNLDTPVEVAARLMTLRSADVLLVTSHKQEVVGLLTHGDISRRLVARNLPVTTAVSQLMSAPIIAVSDQEMVMDAFTLMVQHKVSYVVVQPTGQGCPAYISLLALSELRKETPEYLINSIQKARSVEEIAQHMQQLPHLMARLVETGTGAATSGKLISRISDAVTERIMEMAIHQLGPAPAPFVFLVLGSDGRREQSLATDQDNAIIYLPQDDKPEDELQEYFLQLGKSVCTLLDAAGYPFCVGKVMAMHPQWCQSLQAMKQQITAWIDIPNPRELLQVGMFFDFRPVYGDFEIAEMLKRHCLAQFRDKSRFFYNLAQSTIAMKPPQGVMGQIVLESSDKQGEYLDIKKPLMTLTAIMRLWSLKYGISERNTMERLWALRTADVLPQSTAEEFSQALRFLMLLRIRNQLQQIHSGSRPSNHIAAENLSELDRTLLKKIFSAIAAHLSRMAGEFRVV